MKILGTKKEVMALDDDLAQFVSSTCSWIHDNWVPEQIGWIFILDDLEFARSLCVVPHCDPAESKEYIELMTIDLEVFDMWEGDAIYGYGYWNVVGVIGQEYGFSIFVAYALVQQLPNFKRNLDI